MKISPVPSVLVENAICRREDGPDFFSSDPLEVRRAKNLCLSGNTNGTPCPVRFTCMQFALRADGGGPETYGVWGGADQWEIRIAAAVEPLGSPVRKARPAKCPYCRSAKNVSEIRDAHNRASQATCVGCGLSWHRARSYVKKVRVPRLKGLASLISSPEVDPDGDLAA